MQPTHTDMPEDIAATFCATLVDEWVRRGAAHAVIAPGSRSTPLALALAARDELQVNVFHDERSASFAALGIGLSTGLPAILLCSSGTAATHFHAAVVEAHQSSVAMIVCTADRPPELRDVGAPQTIDQIKLFGNAVRWFSDPGVADARAAHTWRSTAAHAFASATGATGTAPGPVHLNLPFREPLIGMAGDLPARHAFEVGHDAMMLGSVGVPDQSLLDEVGGRIRGRHGIVVAGRGSGDPTVVADFAASLGWPVLADARSGLRTGRFEHVITAFDDIVRSDAFVAANAPDIVIHLGEAPVSKVLGRWLAGLDALQIHVSDVATWRDPDAVIDLHITADVGIVCAGLAVRAEPVGQSWLGTWTAAERLARAAIATVIDASSSAGLSEPATARIVGGSLPVGANFVISSSMPVRDVEWYASVLGESLVYSNRGANGIDGVIATAIGVATGSGAPTFVLIGDVAFLHDCSSLIALARRPIDLRIVLIDNDGGGIFSFLPQATSLPSPRYEQLFGTPHGVDLLGLAAAHSLPTTLVVTAVELSEALTVAGPHIVLVRSDRNENVAVHDSIHLAVAAALG